MAGVSTRHFYRIVAKDRIRTIQIGRKVFILASDFAYWARNKKPTGIDSGSFATGNNVK